MPQIPADLPENDRALIDAVREGCVWSPRGKPPTPKQLADPAFAEKMPAIQADTIRALSLGLWDDVVADPRGVQIGGARIVGNLDLSFGAAQGPLSLQGCHFTEELAVQEALLPALILRGSHLAKGLRGDGVRVEGDLFCDIGFHSAKEICLIGACVGGDVSFKTATLVDGAGNALSADRMVIKGSLFCNGDLFISGTFNSKGTIRLLGAQIDGDADFSNAVLDGVVSYALIADRMFVGRLLCRNGFNSAGDVSLSGITVSGLLDWRPGKWTGLLNLSHSICGQWYDGWEKRGWSSDGTPTLNLTHFTYSAFFNSPQMETDSTSRIAWIQAAQGDDFKPSPYRTLARVLRAAGDERGAAAVGLAMARARAKHQAQSYSWPGKWLYRLLSGFFDVTIGHGYQPWRGAIGLLLFLLVGTVAFGLNAPASYDGPGLIKPADPVFITENQTRNLEAPPPTTHAIQYELPPEYTPFNAFWYSFDTLIPLIDLGQEKAWSPSPLTPKISDDILGWALLFYLYFHIIAGWVLTTLTVVALTGLVKRDPDGEE